MHIVEYLFEILHVMILIRYLQTFLYLQTYKRTFLEEWGKIRCETLTYYTYYTPLNFDYSVDPRHASRRPDDKRVRGI